MLCEDADGTSEAEGPRLDYYYCTKSRTTSQSSLSACIPLSYWTVCGEKEREEKVKEEERGRSDSLAVWHNIMKKAGLWSPGPAFVKSIRLRPAYDFPGKKSLREALLLHLFSSSRLPLCVPLSLCPCILQDALS